jgi:hypothetical protein
MSDLLALAERLEAMARHEHDDLSIGEEAAAALREAHAEIEHLQEHGPWIDDELFLDGKSVPITMREALANSHASATAEARYADELKAEVERLRALLPVARTALQKTMGAFAGTCAWHADVADAIARIDAELGEKHD